MVAPSVVLLGAAAVAAGVYAVLGGDKGIAGRGARDLAREYGGRDEDEASFARKFAAMWDLTWRAKTYEDENHATMALEVLANLVALQSVAAVADASPTGAGPRRDLPDGRDHLRSYRVAPANRSYVVFSDLHLTDRANRQNFFETANKALYLDLLRSHYGPKGFTLVENGDIEELLIQEPELGAMPDFAKDDWAVILADRATRKRAQFRRILADHPDYYQVIHDHFIARDAYHRTIGNHDYDLATDAYVNEIKATLGFDFPAASDMLLLARQGKVEEIICHGHQFDTVCTARHAAYAGESFSQGGGWAFQGPDRNWTDHRRHDATFLREWREGERAFTNMLVSASPGGSICEFLAAVGKFAGTLKDADKWEALYGKNIAWEYFVHDAAADAFHKEVKEGIRWYKYRHMDEVLIAAMLPPIGPRLTLGHSHEPRLRPGIPGGLPAQPARVTDRYMNAAAAGRFENLVWGIEIANGTETLVSWSREPDGRLRRTEWTDRDVLDQRHLIAADHRIIDPVPADAPPAAAPFPSAAVTHLLLT